MAPKTGVSGSFVLPNCEYTAPTGKQFMAYYVNGVYYQPGDTINVQANTVVWVYWKNASAGATVSGTVTSFGSETDDITIELYAGGSTSADYTVTVKGNAAEYSIKGVAAGTYTLRVVKNSHVTCEYAVVVGNNDVTQDVKLHLFGDANCDGGITSADYTLVKRACFNTYNFEGAALLAADANCDGNITSADYALIKRICFGTYKA